MGASFRNTSQIIYLAGSDLLTISPNLLEELSKSFEPITRKLSREIAKASDAEKINLEEKGFASSSMKIPWRSTRRLKEFASSRLIS
jgi:transaldolase